MNRTLLVPLLLLFGCETCGKKPPEPPPVVEKPVVEPAPAPKPPAPEPVAQMARNFERVFFDFDSAVLTDDSKSALSDNVKIMQDYPDVKLEVQGHADERGTTDYNLALGQKRADAVMQYLLASGISTSRVKTVSYGEERPLDGQHTERAWSQNRRAEFIITWSGDAPVKGTSN
jgi:peptidoglycan-associated lipoprotein